MLYFNRLPGRLTVEEIETLYPGLVGALVAHPGIGFVVARTRDRGAVVLGAGGIRYLRDDRVEGADPLAPFGPHAVADVRRHDTLAHVGDLVVNSPIDPDTEEVAAYEELVGCHGGLGGWQTEAVLVHPADWTVDDGPLVGADAVHHQLVRWLERIGQRSGLNHEGRPETSPRPPPSPEHTRTPATSTGYENAGQRRERRPYGRCARPAVVRRIVAGSAQTMSDAFSAP